MTAEQIVDRGIGKRDLFVVAVLATHPTVLALNQHRGREAQQPSGTVAHAGFLLISLTRNNVEVDDRIRLNLHRKLEETLGPQDADALMAHLPPVTWNEVATKDDLRALESVLRAEITAQGSELRGEMSTQGAEISTFRAEISSLRSEMATQGAELRGEISRAMERQIRWMVTFNTALVVIALTAARMFF